MSCKKKEFASKEEAYKKIEAIKKAEEGNDNRIPLRAYVCPKCKKYHLTSFTKGKQQLIVRIRKTKKNRKIKNQAEFWINKKQWDLSEYGHNFEKFSYNKKQFK